MNHVTANSTIMNLKLLIGSEMSPQKKQITKKKTVTKRKMIFRYALGGTLFVILLAIGLYIQFIFKGLPSLEQLENPKPRLASNVYSADGEQIGQFFRENRIEINIDSLPVSITNLLIATEDRKFYDHWGVDLDRFFKAMVKNVFMFKREGASTITQQLAKNLYELKTRDETLFDTITRKLREWITAVQIEKTYTKKEILEMYFNVSYFGRGAYGIEMASKVYFGKSAKELSIPEAAVLIPLLKNPYGYDPVRFYNRSVERRNIVLYNMFQTDGLSEEEYQFYKDSPINVEADEVTKGFKSSVAPHFVEYIRQQMEDMSDQYGYDLYEDGLTIYTSLDSKMQKIATDVTVKHIEDFQKQFDPHWNWRTKDNRAILNDMLDKAIKRREDYRKADREARKEIYNRLKNNVAFVDSIQEVGKKIEVGFIVLDVKTGEVKAMVGGRDQSFQYGLNHTTQIKRQPGSSFKPIVYAVAIDNGLYPAYPIMNQPFLYGQEPNEWSPHNIDMSTGGFTTLREALRRSVNLVSARLIIEGHVQLWKVGIFAEQMGIKTKLDLYPAISLGASVVAPIEMANAYATLANKGIHNEPISILRIEDKDGILLDQFASEASEAIPEETAYIVVDMLQTVINEGSGLRARTTYNFHRPAGGKTGTNTDFADAWFVGFTPQLAGAVWVGFDDQRVRFTGNYGQGSRAALPIWAMFMHDVYEEIDLPLEDFEMPESGDIARVNFCKETIFDLGDPKLYSNDCKSGILSDIIRLRDIPNTYNAERDTMVKIFDRYLISDSLAHEATEIIE